MQLDLQLYYITCTLYLWPGVCANLTLSGRKQEFYCIRDLNSEVHFPFLTAWEQEMARIRPPCARTQHLRCTTLPIHRYFYLKSAE